MMSTSTTAKSFIDSQRMTSAPHAGTDIVGLLWLSQQRDHACIDVPMEESRKKKHKNVASATMTMRVRARLLWPVVFIQLSNSMVLRNINAKEKSTKGKKEKERRGKGGGVGGAKGWARREG